VGVPKVTDAHLAARRQQILDAARTCFQRNGFHATSMQQVIAEAGLSVGAVYRYFPSKNDLIAAIAEQVVSEMGALLAGSAQPGVPLVDVLTRAVDKFHGYLDPDGPVRMAVQLWAEAMRDPRLAEVVGGVYRRLRSRFVEVARTAQRSGELSTAADAEAIGAALFALFPGYGLQRLLTGSPDPEEFKAALRALLGAHC
jgi:AcrR family transcriptional regulator